MNDLLVLCYHAVSDRWPSEFAVTPAQLREQVGALLSRGYRPVTFTEAVVRGVAGRTLAITFDDAFRSVAEHALPVLSELGAPATVFACSSFVGSEQPMPIGFERWVGTPLEPELLSMSWPELRGLAGSGWEVGSHTRSHPHLTQMDDARLEAEIAGSKADLEDALGARCTSLAYPYGDMDARVAQAARDAGYEAAGALLGTFHGPQPHRCPRVVVYRGDTGGRFRLKTSPMARRLRGSGLAWRVLDPVHRLTGGGRGHRRPA